jgi:hypothetical protein
VQCTSKQSIDAHVFANSTDPKNWDDMLEREPVYFEAITLTGGVKSFKSLSHVALN